MLGAVVLGPALGHGLLGGHVISQGMLGDVVLGPALGQGLLGGHVCSQGMLGAVGPGQGLPPAMLLWQGQALMQAPAEVRAGAGREGRGALGRALGALLPAGRARGTGGSSPLEPGPTGAAPGVSPELGRGRGRTWSPRAQAPAGCGLTKGRQSYSSVRCLSP